MSDLAALPAFWRKRIHMVVETPRGCGAKFAYDRHIWAFRYERPLPAGIVYPYDWGFIPSTLGEDGDPLDGLLIHSATGVPGLVVRCRLIGMIAVEQRQEGRKDRNDRFVLCPDSETDERLDEVSPRLRREIEQFFAASVLGTGKALAFQGWKGEGAAHAAIEKGCQAFRRRRAA